MTTEDTKTYVAAKNGWKEETVESFLKRGGKIKVFPAVGALKSAAKRKETRKGK